MSAAPRRTHTPLGEYLALEAATMGQKPRMEYDGHDIVMMGGASRKHIRIVRNLIVRTQSGFDQRGCETGFSDQRVKVGRSYRYPDFVVYCGTPEWTGEKPDTLVNPTLIVEVLSDSTMKRDMTTKLLEYTAIPSLLEYWIIEQDAPLVVQHVRDGDAWRFHLHEEGGAIPSALLDAPLPLAAIYEGVSFDEDAAPEERPE